MKGKLYGIGVGPGDPELLTIKAIKTMEKCDVIAVPSSNDGEKTAYNIVLEYIKDKEQIECPFSMEKNKEKRIEKRKIVANSLIQLLEEGKTIGFITLGDPTIYSTYMYIHKIVKEKGYDTEIISGIPSFVATAAALDISLCEGDETLHIIPGTNEENICKIKNIKGNKVIMKSGRNMNKVLDTLEKMNMDVSIVERCTMKEEKIVKGLANIKKTEPMYFSVIIGKE